MKIAIIGQSGQLARALLREGANQNIDIESYSRKQCDLSSAPEIIERFIHGLQVDAVILAAAYTAVDAAEQDYETAFAVNARAPEAIANACAQKGFALVHVSTDYVFKGDAKSPYLVSAPTNPINAYGLSKCLGEQAVMKAHEGAAVLRTSWVFDGTGKNFMTTMLRLGAAHDAISVVNDQIGRPTYAGHLAQACLAVAGALCRDNHARHSGIYHVTNSGDAISWAGFATAIFARSEKTLEKAVRVTPIPSSDYPTPADRPAYSVLDLSRFETLHGTLPHWHEGLELAYTEWANNKI